MQVAEDALDEDDRPTVRRPELLEWNECRRASCTPAEIPTLPSAISVQALPAFDDEATRFFAAPALAEGAALDDELTAWWSDQRRRSLAPLVTAVVAACVLLLAAVAR